MPALRYRYFQPSNGLFAAPHLPVLAGSDYVEVYEGWVEVDSKENLARGLEKIWETHNIDTRPRAQEIRSMSVGDLVALEDAGWFRAEWVGFAPFDADQIRVLPGVTLHRGALIAVPLHNAEGDALY